MTTTVGASTPYQLTVPELTETADIQVALKLLAYGQSADPSNDADIEPTSLVGYLKTGLALKSNIASPTFTGTVYAPAIRPAVSASTSLALSTINQTSSAGSISITAGNSTSNGSGGSISLTAGSYSASGSAGDISINAGGGPSTGSVNIQTSMGNNGAINLGGSSSTTAVGGDLTVGGGFGSSGVTVSSAGAIQADGAISATGTVTGGNFTTGGSITRTTLANGGTTGASFNNSGALVRTTSSERYKQDIQDANFIYEDVLKLVPKTFRLKKEVKVNPASKVYGGLIAEDVDRIESLKVFVNYETQDDGSKIPDGIAYGEMVSALVSAIKHQDALIKVLENRIRKLEN